MGEREVDLDGAVVRSASGVIALTVNEVRLLQVLVARRGEAVDREQLLTEGLGYLRPLATRAIDQAIWRLRRKLEEDAQNPRHLQSDRHTGYRLVLQLPERVVGPSSELIGREPELARLRQWQALQVPEIWLVGLPGSGRTALATALQAQGTRLRLSVAMPAPPSPALRLGSLSLEAGCELLQRAVLSARGALALQAGESASLRRLCEAVGGHPGSLVATARASVEAPLDALQPRFDPRVALWSDELPEPVVQLALRLAVFPAAFTAADAAAVGVDSDALALLWRSGLCEGGAGAFCLEEVVRQALMRRGQPDAPTWGLFARRVREQLSPLVVQVAETSRDEAKAALLELAPRIEAALRQVEHPELGLAQALCSGDPQALSHPDLPLPVRAVAQARLALVHPETLPATLSWWEAQCGQSPLPLLRAWSRRLCGRWHLREGRGAQAREEMVNALALFESLEAAGSAREVAADLAEVALFLARPDEGLAWAEQALSAGLDDQRETELRLRCAELALARGDLALWRQQLELLELLGHRPTALAVQRALLEMVEGDAERAAVRLLALEGLQEGADTQRQRRLALAWARLLQRRSAEANAVLDELERLDPPEDAAQLEALQFTRWAGSIGQRADVPDPARPSWACWLRADPDRLRAQGLGHPLLALGWRLLPLVGGS